MKSIILALSAFLANWVPYYSPIQELPLRSTKKNLITSLIIPCHYKHAKHLYELLSIYEKQTRLPDEVVISISEIKNVDPNLVGNLEKESWAFPVKILTSPQKLYAGQNRNKACQHAVGDILICQDADDLPHIQRIEIIHHFFKNPRVYHLMHQWKGGSDVTVLPKQVKKMGDVPFVFPNSWGHTWQIGYIQNGCIAISKVLFQSMKWSSKPRGQDVAFNASVYSRFLKNCIVVKFPLTVYRSGLSSTRLLYEEDKPNTKALKMYKVEIINEDEE